MYNVGKTRREREDEARTIELPRTLARPPVIVNQRSHTFSSKGKKAYTRKGRNPG